VKGGCRRGDCSSLVGGDCWFVNGTHNRDQKELVLDKSEPTRIAETREKQQKEFAHFIECEYRLIPWAILSTGEKPLMSNITLSNFADPAQSQ
jgi:hypothetical protein